MSSKLRSIFLVSIVPFLLSSCAIEKFSFSEEFFSKSESGIKYLTSYDVIREAEKSKKSFPVFVHIATCASCRPFIPILEEYTKKVDLICYAIEFSKITDDTSVLATIINYTPSIALYKEGKIVTFLDPINAQHSSYFTSVDNLGEWFNQYITF